MAHGLLTGRAQLESLFDELASELDRLGTSAEIVMVGGSWMLWHAHRSSTRDVDSARRIASEVVEAVGRVGARHDLSSAWLNDDAAGYWPAGASHRDCEVGYERPALIVRTPGPEVIFVMKLYRADPQDREDMVTLWPLCGFSDAGDAVAAFWRAYPHAPDDDHLDDYIADIARDAGEL